MWTFKHYKNNPYTGVGEVWIIYDENQNEITRAYSEANAALIAAAPDLLEALKDLFILEFGNSDERQKLADRLSTQMHPLHRAAKISDRESFKRIALNNASAAISKAEQVQA